MKTTIQNVESKWGNLKLVVFIEGSEQKCHVFKGGQIVARFSYSKDEDANIDLLDVLKSDISQT